MAFNKSTVFGAEKTLGLLNFYKDKDNKVSKTNNELRDELNLCNRTVIRYLNYLELEKKIKRHGRRYRVLEVL